MKRCPKCFSGFPDNFKVCPHDSAELSVVGQLAAGDTIRRKYRIVEEIGRGGMGIVYRASHVLLKEERALKIINVQYANNPQFVQRFLTEALIARQMQHPNIVRVEDADETDDGQPFVVMEYIRGENVRSIIQRDGCVEPLRALYIAGQVCAALTSAHQHEIIHRDIKPDNILVAEQADGSELVKVADFGIAKAKGDFNLSLPGASTQTGIVVGTPQYCSPEQALGKKGMQIDARSDIYSLGIVLYEMLTGQAPFSADTPLGILQLQIESKPPPPQTVKADLNISEAVVNVILKAIEKDPAARFATAEEMRLALDRAAQSLRRLKPRVAEEKKVAAVVPSPPVAAPASSPVPGQPVAPVNRVPAIFEAKPDASVPPVSIPATLAKVEASASEVLNGSAREAEAGPEPKVESVPSRLHSEPRQEPQINDARPHVEVKFLDDLDQAKKGNQHQSGTPFVFPNAEKKSHFIFPIVAAVIAAMIIYLLFITDSSPVGVSHVSRGNELMDQGKVAEAAGEFSQAVTADPSNDSNHVLLGNAYYGQRLYQSALEQYREAYRLNSYNDEAKHMMGAAEKALNPPSPAKPDPAPSSAVDNVDHVETGIQFFDRGRYSDAEKELRLAVKAKPDLRDPHYWLGLVLNKRGRLAEAEKELREAVRLMPADNQAHNDLANVLVEQNRAAEAEREYREAIRLSPQDDVLRSNLADLYYTQNKVPEADKESREALKINPNSAAAHNTLGNIFYDRQRWDDAIEEYRKAVQSSPRNAIMHYNLANALKGSSNFPAAAVEYRKFLVLAEKDPTQKDTVADVGRILKEIEK